MFLSRRVEAAKNEVLRITFEFLQDHYDAELRIAEICERAELSSTVIYSYFQSREGLLDAAYIWAYQMQEPTFDLGILTSLEANPHPPFQLSNIPTPVGVDVAVDFFNEYRSTRLRIYARSIERPEFDRLFSTTQRLHFEKLTKTIQERFADSGFELGTDQLMKSLSTTDTFIVSRAINLRTPNPLPNEDWMTFLNHVFQTNLYRD